MRRAPRLFSRAPGKLTALGSLALHFELHARAEDAAHDVVEALVGGREVPAGAARAARGDRRIGVGDVADVEEEFGFRRLTKLQGVGRIEVDEERTLDLVVIGGQTQSGRDRAARLTFDPGRDVPAAGDVAEGEAQGDRVERVIDRGSST